MARQQHSTKSAPHLLTAPVDCTACPVKPANDQRVIELVRLLARQAARELVDGEMARAAQDHRAD
jgi:hypothetical protein